MREMHDQMTHVIPGWAGSYRDGRLNIFFHNNLYGLFAISLLSLQYHFRPSHFSNFSHSDSSAAFRGVAGQSWLENQAFAKLHAPDRCHLLPHIP